jgi:hypothetical protein
MPLPSTYIPIATVKTTAEVATITMSNIPQTYTDLILVATCGNPSSAVNYNLQFNGDSGSNYSTTYMVSSGGTLSGGSTAAVQDKVYLTQTGANLVGKWGSQINHIMNYSSTNTFKTVLSRMSSDIEVALNTSIYKTTTAITSVTILSNGVQIYTTGSYFTLYGLKAA